MHLIKYYHFVILLYHLLSLGRPLICRKCQTDVAIINDTFIYEGKPLAIGKEKFDRKYESLFCCRNVLVQHFVNPHGKSFRLI